MTMKCMVGTCRDLKLLGTWSYAGVCVNKRADMWVCKILRHWSWVEGIHNKQLRVRDTCLGECSRLQLLMWGNQVLNWSQWAQMCTVMTGSYKLKQGQSASIPCDFCWQELSGFCSMCRDVNFFIIISLSGLRAKLQGISTLQSRRVISIPQCTKNKMCVYSNTEAGSVIG